MSPANGGCAVRAQLRSAAKVKRLKSVIHQTRTSLPTYLHLKGRFAPDRLESGLRKQSIPALLHSLCNLSMIGLGPHFPVDFLWILGTHSLCCGVSPFNDSTTRLWSFVKERRRPVCEDCQQRRGPCRLTLITFLCDNAASGSSLGK